MKYLLFFVTLTAVKVVKCSNILIALPCPFMSHTNSFMPLFKELASRGHNITMISPIKQTEPTPNWTSIVTDKADFSFIYNVFEDIFHFKNRYSMIAKYKLHKHSIIKKAFEQEETLKQFIASENNKFDLIMLEPMFVQESLIAFGHKFNAPVIALNSLPILTTQAYITGNPLFPPDYPNKYSKYSNNMNFIQRLDNALINILDITIDIFYDMPIQEELMEKHMVYRGSENRPSMTDMLRNISLTLFETHFSMGYMQPLQPNVIPIGGIHLANEEILPTDLKEYMDKSQNGFIYLSLGSYTKVELLGNDALNAILSTVRRLKYSVLMKWDNVTIVNKPRNVEIRKWFPQKSVLAHPNCLLFISHGGIHGLIEAATYGVPIVGIPCFIDQFINLHYAVSAGFAIIIEKETITDTSFQGAIEAVINNKKYKENAVRTSKIANDRPMTPLETAVYWVEYVLRHKDQSHLKPANLKLSLHEILLIDVVIILFLAIFSPIIIAYILFKVIISSRKKKQLNTKKKNKIH